MIGRRGSQAWIHCFKFLNEVLQRPDPVGFDTAFVHAGIESPLHHLKILQVRRAALAREIAVDIRCFQDFPKRFAVLGFKDRSCGNIRLPGPEIVVVGPATASVLVELGTWIKR
jgi:hypothetical protein